MKLGKAYERLLESGFKKLQEPRVREEGEQHFVTRILGPEYVPDYVLKNWLAMNYIWTLDFGKDGSPMMGEVGGILPEYDNDRILAVARRSVEKVFFGFEKMHEFEKGNQNALEEIRKTLGVPIKKRRNITVVQGTSNLAHYDFQAIAGAEDVADWLSTNGYLLFAAEGVTVVSNKWLPKEHYSFAVPENHELFEILRKTETGSDDRIGSVKKEKKGIMPEGFIAGVHIAYNGPEVLLSLLLPERDAGLHESTIEKMGLKAARSPVRYIGSSDVDGNFGLLEKELV